ncbi:MAG: hypothetical protein N3D10_02495 [Candidatus Micrarchaeota archaeon]|nr:hypothetical protein [Candidatus Micrarchaeota archaeon]
MEEDCKISYKLKDILPKNEQFFLRLIKHLESLEKENIYSSIISFSKLRQIGCVDARIRNILIPNNYIKEIGSTLNSYQIKNLLNSDLDAIISSSHTNCGYISTLYSIHIANNELREVFGDKKPILRKILEASYSKLLNGKIGVFFGHAEVKAAINEAELSGLFISEKTKRFLLDFISYPSHDTRKTLRHALFRQKVYIDDEGYLVLKAAKNLEEKINQLPYKLSQQKIDFLLNEESARENIKSIIENLSKSNDANSITALASYVFEIGSANKLSISLSPPEKEEDFYFISRKLFFDPKKEIAL